MIYCRGRDRAAGRVITGGLFQVAFARQDIGFVGVQKCFMARAMKRFAEP